MLSPSEMKAALSDRKLVVVAERSGVSYNTILRFVSGANIRQTSLERLSEYLETSSPAMER